MEETILYTSENDCCACGSCVNICPKNAISLKENNKGFLYPYIDKNKCIECDACLKVCPWKKETTGKNISKVFAVVNKEEKILKSSSSGGAFSALAKWILSKEGIVYGCAWNEQMLPYHRKIQNESELHFLQGSKYVQSDVGLIYRDVKLNLIAGKFVLFSGTPCQCDALRSFLGKEYEKLYCVELICHGVPNANMFHEYIKNIEKKLHGKIKDIHFRDKKLGWGALLKVDYIDKNKKVRTKYFKPEESYYYYYFFYKSLFFRESCYSCKYAKEDRYSDFTIGDFWGGEKNHIIFKNSNGISVLIATGSKAINIVEELNEYLYIEESTIDSVKLENEQLRKPSAKDIEYDSLYKKYTELGTQNFEKWYKKTHRKKLYKGRLKRLIPLKLKKILKSIMY